MRHFSFGGQTSFAISILECNPLDAFSECTYKTLLILISSLYAAFFSDLFSKSNDAAMSFLV
ncbi:hypothetical protein VCRA2113O360_40217 [Vibrio crassostreae]|nr:hypothetical protein VCRA2119O381_300019 [Vibrio crassostreae]CAK2510057.1 hypothetical protein VCRA2113O360_40217 [Vibrio crassostreae]CAK2927954.1 hypothetical protein VCRA2119O383_30216 [Vibrio crassostreae]CAK3380158.1 hypothetical protein VCRA2120O387_20215 [Vibrio crassostreae]